MDSLSHPADAGIPSEAEKQLPEADPANLEMQRIPPGRPGERGSLTSEPGLLQKVQGQPPKLRESMEVSVKLASFEYGSAAGAEPRRSQECGEEFGECRE